MIFLTYLFFAYVGYHLLDSLVNPRRNKEDGLTAKCRELGLLDDDK